MKWLKKFGISFLEEDKGITEVNDPPPCDDDIFNGVIILWFDAGKEAMEGLIREARRSGLKVDWHYIGGRAVVKTLDDPEKVREVVLRSIPRRIG